MPFAPLSSLLTQVIGFINVVLIPLILAIAFLMFVWGVVKMFFLGGGEERLEGRKFIMWAVIAFVVIFSIWGLVNILMASLGFGGQMQPNLPRFRPQ